MFLKMDLCRLVKINHLLGGTGHFVITIVGLSVMCGATLIAYFGNDMISQGKQMECGAVSS